MAGSDPVRFISRKAFVAVTAMLAVLLVGTAGYRWLGGPGYSMLDCLYMTVITVLTIGYGEVVDLSHNPAGRVFTMVVAFFGIGILTYVVSSVTSFAVDGDLRARWRARMMQKTIDRLSGHFILCGWSEVGQQILAELISTRRDVVVIAPDPAVVARAAGQAADRLPVLQGEGTEDELLQKAGIGRAAGLFAEAGGDHVNIVICLAARQMNPSLRIVAGVREPANAVRLQKAGADAVVSTVTIGALRMASEMVRPTVVSFLDTMLRDRERALRIEEIALASRYAGTTVGGLGLDAYRNSLLLAIRCGSAWGFRPPNDQKIAAGDVLIVMTTPAEREELKRTYSSV